MSRGRRSAVVLAVAVAAPLAAGVGYAVQSRPGAADPAAAAVAISTAAVERGTLTERIQADGTLTYADSYTVTHRGEPGVLTRAASPGATVDRGGILYAVANNPIRLLLGAVPAYRDFGYGMTDGPDVRQLESNLVAMGFDPYRRITVDRHFSAATAAAIRRWEKSWGRPAYQRTGRLIQGQVVFLPTAMRVAEQQVKLGATAAPEATVLTGTSTRRVVTVGLQTDQQSSVHLGDTVEVELPESDPIRGRVTGIGRVATAGDPGGQNGGPPQPDADSATVEATVAVTVPGGGPALDETPVTVSITTRTLKDVLLVPVTALLSRPGGGYQVRLADGTAVPVELGAYDESRGQVEITSGLTEGQRVEVPS